MSVPAHLVHQTSGGNHLPPSVAPTGTPGVVIPHGQAALPTEEQMRNPYDPRFDPTRAGTVDQHIADQTAINPREQGERLALARQETQTRLAMERAQYLEQQLAQSQQFNQQNFAAIQQQLAANSRPAPVDPLAAFQLSAEERELAGEQLPIVEKIAQRMATQAQLQSQQEMDRRIAELEARVRQQIEPLQQGQQNTTAQIQQDWNNRFVMSVQQEMGFDPRALAHDPSWEAFAAQVVPYTGGLTFGQQLTSAITSRDTSLALDITRNFHQMRQAGQQQQMDPTAGQVAPHQGSARATAHPVSAPDPSTQAANDVAEYRRLTDQLARQQINIAQFAQLTKPIDDRLKAMNQPK